MMSRDKQIQRVTWFGLAINAVLTAFKLVAGLVERRLTEHFGPETQISIHVEPDNFSHEHHE